MDPFLGESNWSLATTPIRAYSARQFVEIGRVCGVDAARELWEAIEPSHRPLTAQGEPVPWTVLAAEIDAALRGRSA